MRVSAVPNSLRFDPGGMPRYGAARPDLNISSPQSFVEILSITVRRDGQTLEITSGVCGGVTLM